MGLSEVDVQKQIKHMLAFIEQEANEKAEEEFNMEKGKLVQQQRIKIMEYYEKKEKHVELQRKIQNSNLASQSKLKILRAKEQHMQHVRDDAKQQLCQLITDKDKYENILKLLIVQALYEMLEPNVSIQCKKSDLPLIQSVLDECVHTYQKTAGQNVTLEIDTSHPLPDDSIGGVILVNKNGKIKVVNTLDSRLQQSYNELVPEIKETLFGRNKNRKFHD